MDEVNLKDNFLFRFIIEYYIDTNEFLEVEIQSEEKSNKPILKENFNQKSVIRLDSKYYLFAINIPRKNFGISKEKKTCQITIDIKRVNNNVIKQKGVLFLEKNMKIEDNLPYYFVYSKDIQIVEQYKLFFNYYCQNEKVFRYYLLDLLNIFLISNYSKKKHANNLFFWELLENHCIPEDKIQLIKNKIDVNLVKRLSLENCKYVFNYIDDSQKIYEILKKERNLERGLASLIMNIKKLSKNELILDFNEVTPFINMQAIKIDNLFTLIKKLFTEIIENGLNIKVLLFHFIETYVEFTKEASIENGKYIKNLYLVYENLSEFLKFEKENKLCNNNYLLDNLEELSGSQEKIKSLYKIIGVEILNKGALVNRHLIEFILDSKIKFASGDIAKNINLSQLNKDTDFDNLKAIDLDEIFEDKIEENKSLFYSSLFNKGKMDFIKNYIFELYPKNSIKDKMIVESIYNSFIYKLKILNIKYREKNDYYLQEIFLEIASYYDANNMKIDASFFSTIEQLNQSIVMEMYRIILQEMHSYPFNISENEIKTRVGDYLKANVFKISYLSLSKIYKQKEEKIDYYNRCNDMIIEEGKFYLPEMDENYKLLKNFIETFYNERESFFTESKYWKKTESTLDTLYTKIKDGKITIKQLNQLKAITDGLEQRVNIVTKNNKLEAVKLMAYIKEKIDKMIPLTEFIKGITSIYERYFKTRVKDMEKEINNLFSENEEIANLFTKEKMCSFYNIFLPHLINERDFYFNDEFNNDYNLLYYFVNDLKKCDQYFLESDYWKKSESILKKIFNDISNGLINLETLNKLTLDYLKNNKPEILTSKINLICLASKTESEKLLKKMTNVLEIVKAVNAIGRKYESLYKKSSFVIKIKSETDYFGNNEALMKDLDSREKISNIFSLLTDVAIKEKDFYFNVPTEDYLFFEFIQELSAIDEYLKESAYWENCNKTSQKLINNFLTGNNTIKELFDCMAMDDDNKSRSALTRRLNIITVKDNNLVKKLLSLINDACGFVSNVKNTAIKYEQIFKNEKENIEQFKLLSKDFTHDDSIYNQIVTREKKIMFYNSFNNNVINEEDFYNPTLSSEYILLEFLVISNVSTPQVELTESEYWKTSVIIMQKIIDDIMNMNITRDQLKFLISLDGKSIKKLNLIKRLDIITQKDNVINNNLVGAINAVETFTSEVRDIIKKYESFYPGSDDVKDLKKYFEDLTSPNAIVNTLNPKTFFNFFNRNLIKDTDFYSPDFSNDYHLLKYFMDNQKYDVAFRENEYWKNSLAVMKKIIEDISKGNLTVKELKDIASIDKDNTLIRPNAVKRMIIITQKDDSIIKNLVFFINKLLIKVDSFINDLKNLYKNYMDICKEDKIDLGGLIEKYKSDDTPSNELYTKEKMRALFNSFESEFLIQPKDFYVKEVDTKMVLLKFLIFFKKFEEDFEASDFWIHSNQVNEKIISDITNNRITNSQLQVIAEWDASGDKNKRPNFIDRLNYMCKFTKDNKDCSIMITNLNTNLLKTETFKRELNALLKKIEQFMPNPESFAKLNELVESYFDGDIIISELYTKDKMVTFFNLFEKSLIKEHDFYLTELNQDFYLLEFFIQDKKYEKDFKQSGYWDKSLNILKKICDNLLKCQITIKELKTLLSLDADTKDANKRPNLVKRLNLVSRNDNMTNIKIVTFLNKCIINVNLFNDIVGNIYKMYESYYKDTESFSEFKELYDSYTDENLLYPDLYSKEKMIRFFDHFLVHLIKIEDFYKPEFNNDYFALYYLVKNSKKYKDDFLNSEYWAKSKTIMKNIDDQIMSGLVKVEDACNLLTIDETNDLTDIKSMKDFVSRPNLLKRFNIITNDLNDANKKLINLIYNYKRTHDALSTNMKAIYDQYVSLYGECENTTALKEKIDEMLSGNVICKEIYLSQKMKDFFAFFEVNLIKYENFFTSETDKDFLLLEFLMNFKKYDDDLLASTYWTKSELVKKKIVGQLSTCFADKEHLDIIKGIDEDTTQRPNLAKRLSIVTNKNNSVNMKIIKALNGKK